MDLDFAFLADAAEVAGGKLYAIGGAFDTIWVSTVPATYPKLALVMRLFFTPAEVGKKHKVEINVLEEDGKRIATVGGDLEIKQNPSLPKGWKHSFLTVLNFANLKFEKFGSYSIEIAVNNFSVKSISLRVAERVQFQS